MKTRAALFRLRVISAVEAVSFILLLGLGSVLKRATDGDIDLVMPLGMLHGVLFLTYVVMWADAWNRVRWDLKRGLLYFIASVIPFAGFYAERKLKAEQERVTDTDPAPAAA